jgi:cobalt-precorrin 5A hydrolase
VIVAGIGCRRGVSTAQVQAAIEAAMSRAALGGRRIALLATPHVKGTEAGILAAAAARGIRLALVSQSALEAADSRTRTRSVRSLTTMNVNSVAEAAALAAAGPLSRLLGSRIGVGPVTCALAEGDDSP